MPSVRHLNSKYGISKNRFRQLYYFCLQYPEWKDELKYNTDTMGAIAIDGMPKGTTTSDPTQALATRNAQLSTWCQLIEQTAIETDADIYQYIIKAVTNSGITYKYLSMIMGIPCGKKMYYDRRRKFYWLLSQKI